MVQSEALKVFLALLFFKCSSRILYLSFLCVCTDAYKVHTPLALGWCMLRSPLEVQTALLLLFQYCRLSGPTGTARPQTHLCLHPSWSQPPTLLKFSIYKKKLACHDVNEGWGM